MNDFADRLKAARRASGMTQKEVAEKIGVAKSTYSLYESGKRTPLVEGVKLIAKTLGVTADELLGLPQTDEVVWLSDNDSVIISSYRNLNADGRRRLLQYAEELSKIYKKD